MSPRTALLGLRLAALVALAASLALAVEYSSAATSFCAPGGGCQAVRRAAFTRAFQESTGLGIPAAGVLAFAGLFALSLVTAPIVRRLLLPAAAGLGALLAAALLAVQALGVGVFCWLCVIVDSAALAAGALGWWARREPGPVLSTARWVAAGAVTVVSPALYPSFAPTPPPPAEVRALFVPERVDVVVFADFQCPHCRALHGRLEKLVASYGDRVRLVRRHAPLPFHPLARRAALAELCASEQGKGDAMASALFHQEDLSPPALRRRAVELGLDPGRYDECIDAPRTAEELERHLAAHRATGLGGVPVTYVEDRVIPAAQPDEVFRDAIDRALSGERRRTVPLGLWSTLTLGLAGVILFLGRRQAPAA